MFGTQFKLLFFLNITCSPKDKISLIKQVEYYYFTGMLEKAVFYAEYNTMYYTGEGSKLDSTFELLIHTCRMVRIFSFLFT